MPRFDAIIFDKDGTLFDFQASWSGWARDMIDRLAGDDIAARARAAEVMGYDLERGVFQKSSPVIAATAQHVADALSKVLPHSADDVLAISIEAAAEAPQVAVAGVQTALQDLSGDYRLGLVTNDNEATAVRHLENLGVAHVFAAIIGYDSGYGAKPAPEPLLGFCRMQGFDPERTVMVGDSRHDLEAGRAAGAVTIGVLTGVADADDLNDLADVILPDVTHIGSWLRRGSDP